MSLIEEALRRVNDPTVPKTASGVSSPAANVPQAPARSPAAHSWSAASESPVASSVPSSLAMVVVAGAIFSLTVALIVGGVWWLGHTFEHSKARVASQVTNPAREVISASEAPTLPASQSAEGPVVAQNQGSLVLSGIVEGSGEPYAMINGLIIRAGQQVGGVTILRIADGSVTVRQADGTETDLRVSP